MITHFKQIVSKHDDLHELSTLTFWEKLEKQKDPYVICWTAQR